MRVLSVSWDPSSDLTKLKFNDEFLFSDWVLRADILRDLVYDLTDKYHQTLKEVTNPVLRAAIGHGDVAGEPSKAK
jgi:hypothetical protein